MDFGPGDGLSGWINLFLAVVIAALIIGIVSVNFVTRDVRTVGEKKENGINVVHGRIVDVFTVHGRYWDINVVDEPYRYTYETGEVWGNCPFKENMVVSFAYEWRKHYYEDCDGSDPRMVWSPLILDWEVDNGVE